MSDKFKFLEKTKTCKMVYLDGIELWIKKLSANFLLKLQEKHGKEGDTTNVQFCIDVVVSTLCNAAGLLLCETAEDVTELMNNLSLDAFQKLAEEVLVFSGLVTREKNFTPPSFSQ